ncbi:MAG: nuclear transport factor 2 family protein [Rhizobiaceae bacterium]
MVPDLETARKIATDHCAAWTSKSADAVAERYSVATNFGMNGNEPMTNRQEIAEMAAGFMAEFPDLVLTCDSVLVADHHMVYAWTFAGHHVDTGQKVEFSGWEEWDLDTDLKVCKSLGWYDVADYERQVAAGQS